MPAGTIEQKDAKKLDPPGGFIWRGNKSGTWQGHYPPMPRRSYSWAVYGQRGAAMRVLQDMWSKWCNCHGVDKSEAPIAGLWE
eukprot:4948088-Heterocapsa_arctica.AAC.1